MQRARVPLGFLCGALVITFARPSPALLSAGGLIALSGLLLRAWAAGHIRKNQVLAVTGPYAYTRNPLYLGSFLLGLGFTVAAGRPVLAVLFAALLLGIYLPVMRVEAKTLARLFPNEYKLYARSVPLFFPRLAPYHGPYPKRGRFDVSLYVRYREYRAALGLLLALCILTLKAAFTS